MGGGGWGVLGGSFSRLTVGFLPLTPMPSSAGLLAIWLSILQGLMSQCEGENWQLESKVSEPGIFYLLIISQLDLTRMLLGREVFCVGKEFKDTNRMFYIYLEKTSSLLC